MTKKNPNNVNEKKQTFFHVEYSNLTPSVSFFIKKKLKSFNDFQN